MRFTARNRLRLRRGERGGSQLVLPTMRSREVILVWGKLRDLQQVGRDDVRTVGVLHKSL